MTFSIKLDFEFQHLNIFLKACNRIWEGGAGIWVTDARKGHYFRIQNEIKFLQFDLDSGAVFQFY